MKHAMSLVVLAIIGLAAPALSERSHRFSLEIQELERMLVTAPFEDVNDDDEVEDNEIDTRGFNPIKWVKDKFKKLKNKCKCEGNACDCCFKVSIFDANVCLRAENLANEHKINVAFVMNDKSVMSHKFSTDRVDSICGSTPAPFDFMKFCFNHQASANGNSISSCSSIDFKAGDITGAVLKFKCINIQGGKVTIGGFTDVDKSAVLTVKAKNPFKKWFKKNLEAPQ